MDETTLTPTELLREIQRLEKADDREGLVALASSASKLLSIREPNREDAETCRLTMLALYKLGDVPRGRVWRVRAMLGAARADWPVGVAALVTGEAFALQELANGSTTPLEPGYRVLDEALDILDELKPLIGPEGPDGLPQPSPELLGRIYHEKRGFLLLAAGRFSEALRSYEAARDYVTHDERGRLKIEGGRALCLYAADPTDSAAAIEATQRVANESMDRGHVEIHRIASENLTRMRAQNTSLIPYETL